APRRYARPRRIPASHGPSRCGYPPGMTVPDIERKRRMARTLLGANRRGFAVTLGLRVTNSPANLFQLLCLSILLRDLGDYRAAAQAAGALRGAWDSAARLARSSEDERVRVLRENGAGRKAKA